MTDVESGPGPRNDHPTESVPVDEHPAPTGLRQAEQIERAEHTARTGSTALPVSGDDPATEPMSREGARLRTLLLAALGIVFGDIGTSPLYALQTVYSIDHNAVEPTPDDVYGVVSLVFWSVTTIVSVKYVVLVMRADNEGEGGILALTALLRRLMRGPRATIAIISLGIVGAGLFYGDSVITPAISVMSAI